MDQYQLGSLDKMLHTVLLLLFKIIEFTSLSDEPEVTIEGFDGNWYLNRQNVQLTCRADANPPVTIYSWKL